MRLLATNQPTKMVSPLDNDLSPSFPDEITRLTGTEEFEAYGASVPEAEAQAQIDAGAAAVGREVEPLIEMGGRSAQPAADQHRARELRCSEWQKRAAASRAAEAALLGLRRHPDGDKWRYWITWAVLAVGDAAGGALVLSEVGEDPILGAAYMLAIGLSIPTLGLLGRDIRQWYEHLAVPAVKRSPEAQVFVDEAFRATDPAVALLRRILAGVALGLVLVAVAAIAVRAEDGWTVAGAFGAWGIVIGVASWVNAYHHADPAGITVASYQKKVADAERAYERSPVDAIATNDSICAQAQMIIEAGEASRKASFRAVATQGLVFLAENPQIDGHGKGQAHRLVSVQPDLSSFDQLRQAVEAVRYRSLLTSPDEKPESDAPETIDLASDPIPTQTHKSQEAA